MHPLPNGWKATARPKVPQATDGSHASSDPGRPLTLVLTPAGRNPGTLICKREPESSSFPGLPRHTPPCFVFAPLVHVGEVPRLSTDPHTHSIKGTRPSLNSIPFPLFSSFRFNRRDSAPVWFVVCFVRYSFGAVSDPCICTCSPLKSSAPVRRRRDISTTPTTSVTSIDSIRAAGATASPLQLCHLAETPLLLSFCPSVPDEHDQSELQCSRHKRTGSPPLCRLVLERHLRSSTPSTTTSISLRRI